MTFFKKLVVTNAPAAVILSGFWSMAHEARTDYAMLLGSTFLLLVGAGAWSFDARIVQTKHG
jgi:putative oxidoreductase